MSAIPILHDATLRPWSRDYYGDPTRDDDVIRLFGMNSLGQSRQIALLHFRNLSEPSWAENPRANAALIVRAVNSYDVMREALELLVKRLEAYVDGRRDAKWINDWEALKGAKAALAQAEGDTP